MNAIEFEKAIFEALNEFKFPLAVARRDANGLPYQRRINYSQGSLAKMLTNEVVNNFGDVNTWIQKRTQPQYAIDYIEDDERGFTINDDLYFAWDVPFNQNY